MQDLSRRDPSTRTRGADNVTMLLWLTIELVPGITRDELVERVGSRVNEGHAKRRYIVDVEKKAAYRREKGIAVRSAMPFSEIPVDRAKRYLIVKTLHNMCRDKTIERDDGGDGYHVLRRPKTDAYQADDAVIDVTGERTRHFMRKADAIRTVKAACRRLENTQHRFSNAEFTAIKVLLECLDAELRRDTEDSP